MQYDSFYCVLRKLYIFNICLNLRFCEFCSLIFLPQTAKKRFKKNVVFVLHFHLSLFGDSCQVVIMVALGYHFDGIAAF